MRLRQADSGTVVGDVCRQLGVSRATFYVWKRKREGTTAADQHHPSAPPDTDGDCRGATGPSSRTARLHPKPSGTRGGQLSGRTGRGGQARSPVRRPRNRSRARGHRGQGPWSGYLSLASDRFGCRAQRCDSRWFRAIARPCACRHRHATSARALDRTGSRSRCIERTQPRRWTLPAVRPHVLVRGKTLLPIGSRH